jgi:hypothetical protein
VRLRKFIALLAISLFSVLPTAQKADAISTSVVQLNASWGLSSLDQPNLGGLGVDSSYIYPVESGAGVRVYIACNDLDDQKYINGQVDGVAKKAEVSVIAIPCIGQDNSALVRSIDYAISDTTTATRKIITVRGDGDRLRNTEVKLAISRAEDHEILVLANALGYDRTSCDGHLSINVGGYSNLDSEPNLTSGGRQINCIDLFAPNLDPLGFLAGVAANYLSKNLTSTAAQAREAILTHAEPESFYLAQCLSNCQNRSLDQQFLLSTASELQATVVPSIVDQDDYPVREATFSNRIVDSSARVVQAETTRWYKCFSRTFSVDNCVLISSAASFKDMGLGFGEYVVSIVTVQGNELPITLISATEKPIRQAPVISGRAIPGSHLELPGALVGQWYTCSERELSASNTASGFCEATGNSLSNSITLDQRSLGKIIRVKISGVRDFFTKSTEVIQKITPSILATAPEDAGINSIVRVDVQVEMDGISCPSKINLTINERKPIASRTVSLKLTSCSAHFKTRVRANTKFSISVGETNASYKASSNVTVLARPTMSVSTPKRAYGSYQLKLKSPQARSIKCSVFEDYYSFGGFKISESLYKISLVNGVGALHRKTKYVGVIKGLITCPRNADYGDSYGSFKVFSY